MRRKLVGLLRYNPDRLMSEKMKNKTHQVDRIQGVMWNTVEQRHCVVREEIQIHVHITQIWLSVYCTRNTAEMYRITTEKLKSTKDKSRYEITVN